MSFRIQPLTFFKNKYEVDEVYYTDQVRLLNIQRYIKYRLDLISWIPLDRWGPQVQESEHSSHFGKLSDQTDHKSLPATKLYRPIFFKYGLNSDSGNYSKEAQFPGREEYN